MRPLVMLNRSSSVMIHRDDVQGDVIVRRDAWCPMAPGGNDPVQVGQTSLQPVSSTEPAAFSPGTGFFTVNMLSASPCGGCASPTKTVLISSWSPARYSGEPGSGPPAGGSLSPASAWASLGASSVFSWLAPSASVCTET